MSFSPFLGKGAKYPFAFNTISGGVEKASSENYKASSPTTTNEDLAKINGSLRLLFSTQLGSRFFAPNFGSDLQKLVFEPNDDVFADALRVYISDAINKWEKRIKLLSIDVVSTAEDIDNNVAKIDIKYRIISSQIIGNFVYPFVRRI